VGHQRLGTLPRSKHWNEVIDLITGGADAPQIAAAASVAAETTMIDAASDPAVCFACWLLAQIPMAAREQDFPIKLRALGVDVSDNPELTDVICGLMNAIDLHVGIGGSRSDYGEIAQLSAAEALFAMADREANVLFGAAVETMRKALGGLATEKQFAVLAREFFARLTRRHLNYFLSRELSNHVGSKRRFASVREHRAFEDALDLHCREATRIIKEYSGEWLSKHRFEGGIDLAKAGRFVSYATEKIRDELRARRGIAA
jgi:hypothetical protein